MAFPPFAVAPIDGLGFYAKDPQVLDRRERGELEGQRRETITYVCQRPGHFIIPAARFTWWNLETKRLETIDFPERVLDVAPNPALPSTFAVGSYTRREWRSALFFSTMLLAAAVLVFRFRRLWSYVVTYFEPVHLAPLNPEVISPRAVDHRRPSIE